MVLFKGAPFKGTPLKGTIFGGVKNPSVHNLYPGSELN